VPETIHRFTHGGIEGAILRILDDEPHSLNELLPDEYKLPEDRTLPLAYTCCYVRHRGRHVMVDGGIDGDEVTAQLDGLDVKPEDVDLVLITHADRDHVAGLILQIGDGERGGDVLRRDQRSVAGAADGHLDRLAAGASWETAIRDAREAGALEGDGAWDLDGWDAAAKLAILAMTVLGVDADLRQIPRRGIRDVDLSWLREVCEEHRVRLLATALRTKGGDYELAVAPTPLPPDHLLGQLGSKEMGIVYHTDLFSSISSVIEEASPLPSAASMLRDILDIYCG